MKIKDITTILNKLEEAGWGDTEIYTEWEEDENVIQVNHLNFICSSLVLMM